MATFSYAVQLTWTTASGSPGNNVFHGRTGGVGFQEDEVAGLSVYLNEFYEAIGGLFPSFVTITAPEYANGVGDDTGDQVPVEAWEVQGSGGAGFLPPANCMLVDWRTGTGGRRGRGRTFVGPLQSTVGQANGTPTEIHRGILEDAASDLIAASSGSLDGAWGVYSRVENVFRDWQSSSVPNLFGVLRSRRD